MKAANYASQQVSGSRVTGHAQGEQRWSTAFENVRADAVVIGWGCACTTQMDLLSVTLFGSASPPAPTATPTARPTESAGLSQDAAQVPAAVPEVVAGLAVQAAAAAGYALVAAGDVTALYAAIDAVNAGIVGTIYLNANGSISDSEAQRTYVLSSRIRFDRDVTVYGNGAILRQTPVISSPTFPRVLFVPPGVTVTMHRVELTGADFTIYTGQSARYGAGVQNNGGTLRLLDSAVYGNTAVQGAGGIWNQGTLELTRVRIEGNRAGGGGGLYQSDAGTINGQCVRVINNTADYGVGLLQAATTSTGTRVTFRNSSFYGNVTLTIPPQGADIYNLAPATVQIDARSNYWGTDGQPAVGDGQSGASILTGSRRTSDPTLPDAGGAYAVAACRPNPARSIPARCTTAAAYCSPQFWPPTSTPTRTATATRTPSPTRTPSRTPTPTLPVCQPSASALSEVSAQATEVCVAPSRTPRPTRTPSATRTFTPSPTMTPPVPPAYKVRFSNELGAGTAWTPDELAVIQTAIGNVGEAFRIQMGLSSPIEAYNRVLVNGDNPDYVYFYRANGISETVTIQYLPGAPQASLTVTVTIGGCQTFNSLPRVIVCNWSPTLFAAFPEQAIVHELGHVFTNRSRYAAGEGDEVIRGLLYAAVQNTYSGVCSPAFSGVNFGNTSGCNRIVDRSPGLVMGLDVDLAWQRGERGWGSGPDNTFTAFQQHPLEVFPDDLPDVQVDETAADMFLNWVYRKVTDPSGTLYAIVPGTWQGFLNISWRNNSTGSNDPSFPGDARYEWMNNVVSRIFVLKGW
jgi:hypothetical protein